MVDIAVERFEKLLRGAIVIILGNVIGMGSMFLARFLSARYLLPENYGLIALGITFVNILSIVSLAGLPRGLARQFPQTEERTELLFAALIVCLPVSFAIAVLVGTYATVIQNIFDQDGFSQILPIFAFSIPFIIVAKIGIGSARGVEKARGQIIIESLSNQLLKLLFIAVAIGIGFQTAGVAIGWVAASVVSAVVAVYYLIRLGLFSSGFEYNTAISHIRPLLLFSLPLMVSESLWRLMKQADNFLLGYFHPSQIVGIYDATFLISRVMFFIPIPFSFLFLPIFSDLYENESKNKRLVFYRLVTKWMVFLVLPIYFSILFFSQELMMLLYGRDYVIGAPVLIVLATGYVIHLVFGLNIGALTAIGQTDKVLYGNSAGFVANLLLNIILIPRFGMLGAAFASALTFVITNVLFEYYLFDIEDIHTFYRPLLQPIITITPILAVLFLVKMHFLDTVVEKLLVITGIFITIFVAVAKLGVESDDVAIVKSLLEELPAQKARINKYIYKDDNGNDDNYRS